MLHANRTFHLVWLKMSRQNEIHSFSILKENKRHTFSPTSFVLKRLPPFMAMKLSHILAHGVARLPVLYPPASSCDRGHASRSFLWVAGRMGGCWWAFVPKPGGASAPSTDTLFWLLYQLEPFVKLCEALWPYTSHSASNQHARDTLGETDSRLQERQRSRLSHSHIWPRAYRTLCALMSKHWGMEDNLLLLGRWGCII